MAMGKAKMAKKKMRGGGMAKKKMMRGGMAKKKMMGGGMYGQKRKKMMKVNAGALQEFTDTLKRTIHLGLLYRLC